MSRGGGPTGSPDDRRFGDRPDDDLVKTGVVDLSELDALLAAPSLDEGSGGPAASASVELERSALARLEDLGDDLYWQEQRKDRQPRRPSAEPRARGSEAPESAPSESEPSRLLVSNLVVAAGTTLSRLTGLLRVLVFGSVIGQGALADAYLIGNETPNIVYELLLGGVLSATLVPLFTSFLESEDRREGERATNAVITVTLTALAVLTALAMIAAPAIFGLYSINTEGDVDPDVLREVGTQLTRVFLLQILFYGLTALLSAYLNARRRFFAAAWSPILANLVVIVALLTLPDQTWQLTDVLTNDRLRLTLSLGTTVGIATMALALVPAARGAGLRFRPVFAPRHPAIKRLLKLSAWTLGYVVCNQIVVVVIRNLSGPGSGDSAAYFNAFVFFVLPHGLLAMSIATTFIPELARAVSRKDRAGFNDKASLGVRVIVLLTLPAAAALFVFRRPMIGLLLQHGEFTEADAIGAARVLGGFALGLTGFSVYLFALRGFYAHQDTRTPFVLNAGQCVLNIVFAVAFVGRWDVLGLGVAFALSYLLAAGWALQVLSYKVRGFPLRTVLASIFRMAVAAALGGEAAWLVAHNVGGNTGAAALGRIIAGSVVGLAVYVAILAVQRAPELGAVRRIARR
jgi:putative peptidoglycan lipid II flippase